MPRFLLLILIGLSTFSKLQGQEYDYLWLLGNDSQTNPEYGGMILDFFDDTLTIFTEYRTTPFRQFNTSLCDSLGNILFYSNGIGVINSLGILMENGAGLNPGFFYDLYENDGYILNQGAVSIIQPESDSIAYIFYMDVDINEAFNDAFSSHVYFATINMLNNNGLGSVLQKNQELVSRKLDKCKITAVKHANGRDWWLLIRSYGSNQYHTFLLNNEGVFNQGIQVIGDSIPSGSVGQAVFSPDGSKYIQANLFGFFGNPFWVNIYNFDRCSGQLYNPVQFTYADSAACLGAAISPNSQFLYISSYKKIFQYDLWAADIEASRITVAEWDGFADEGIFSNTFYLAQLAPDGKIYINSNNSTRHLHVINHPDSLGLACEVCQHCVELPSWNYSSMPNFPNYRLAHEADSPCDTLRPPPTAAWNYESSLLQLSFHDASTHDIRAWRWAFGDGATDTLAHPVHTYAQAGTYQVCLTATNPRGADTHCEQVAVFTTGLAGLEEAAADLAVFPNPTKDRLLFVTLPLTEQDAWLQLSNAQGLRLNQWPIGRSQQQIKLELVELPAGIYFLNWSDGVNNLTKKVILH